MPTDRPTDPATERDRPQDDDRRSAGGPGHPRDHDDEGPSGQARHLRRSTGPTPTPGWQEPGTSDQPVDARTDNAESRNRAAARRRGRHDDRPGPSGAAGR
jgi:hypothetical protein